MVSVSRRVAKETSVSFSLSTKHVLICDDASFGQITMFAFRNTPLADLHRAFPPSQLQAPILATPGYP
jgi:hypothetical protein